MQRVNPVNQNLIIASNVASKKTFHLWTQPKLRAILISVVLYFLFNFANRILFIFFFFQNVLEKRSAKFQNAYPYPTNPLGPPDSNQSSTLVQIEFLKIYFSQGSVLIIIVMFV